MLAPLTALLALAPLPVAQAPAEPAPTNVRLSWVSADHQQFAVTWDETGDVRNVVELVPVDGHVAVERREAVAAGQPNRLVYNSRYGFDPDHDYRVRVTVVDADDTALSDPATSPVFDTDRPAPPAVTSVVPRVDGSIRFAWVPRGYTDHNPGDPLDVPAGPVRWRATTSSFELNEYYPQGPEFAGAGSYVLTGPPARPPVEVGLETTPNEWGSARSLELVAGTTVTAKLPATATVGGTLSVTGKVTRVSRICDPGVCSPYEEPDKGREVKLQARSGADGQWRTVSTGRSLADGTFSVRTAFTATGDYRVVALPVAGQGPSARGAKAYGQTTATTVAGVTGPTGDGGNEGGGGGGGGLPITGAPVVWIGVLGGLLVLGGAGLAFAGRLRRRAGSS
ncbi:hypothetical protein [Actinoplanes sp. URMC 104]|uniref:hypothetical protein n=1 Tax=Actinoplanes sp. URMC 104 TaxID=3423409 RepID=UPI003F1D5289